MHLLMVEDEERLAQSLSQGLIATLRRKLDRAGTRCPIETVRGIGYRPAPRAN
ncbi:hypothetical protein [Kitasatospora sp. GP82]|uniref:hypothetical protein n=1 Tax=Kitasatospora sp. GP82 TaxID=3035089 RepID=UPI002473A106|nr:hypothetical protein [Kitasatospora sp. GP82]MDH6128115.1 DNA-binding response OmpR family regulator [Kitasatospora sp. GP82]